MASPKPAVRRLGRISFRYDAVEDRICCVGIPAGVATGHIVMWMTNRLGYSFLESVHAKRPDKPSSSSKNENETVDDLKKMVDYGNKVVKARKGTQKAVTQGDPTASAPMQQAAWLIRSVQVQRPQSWINLILIGDDDAAGFILTDQQFLRIVDMLEDAFRQANWTLPDRSYSNLGSKLAEASGQRLN